MNEFVDIIVIYVVLRAILAFLGAWWHGEDATISDETDKLAGNVKSYGDNSYSP